MIAKKYMCPDCYKLFTESKATEMKFKHHCHKAYDGDYLIPIDEPIAEAISLMNQKGYTTNRCCSGHWNSENNEHYKITDFYVAFYAPVSALNFLLSHIPIGLEMSYDMTNAKYRNSCGKIGIFISAEESILPVYSVDLDDDHEYKDIDEEFYNTSQKWANDVYAFSLKKWVEMLPEADSFNEK